MGTQVETLSCLDDKWLPSDGGNPLAGSLLVERVSR